MTKITRKTVRETDADHRGRKLVVQLMAKGMWVGPKGSPSGAAGSVFVPYEAIYEFGLKRAAGRMGHPSR